MRAVQVVIHSAEGLVSCKTNKPPSAYASVYLLGDQERYYLTAKTKETKTTVIDNNADPVWEQEFILHGPQGWKGHCSEGKARIKVQGILETITWDKLPYPAHALCQRQWLL